MYLLLAISHSLSLSVYHSLAFFHFSFICATLDSHSLFLSHFLRSSTTVSFSPIDFLTLKRTRIDFSSLSLSFSPSLSLTHSHTRTFPAASRTYNTPLASSSFTHTHSHPLSPSPFFQAEAGAHVFIVV